MAFLIPIFAGIATALGASAAVATVVGSVAAFAATTLLTIGVSKLLSNTSTNTGSQGANPSAADPRSQKSPTTVNKLSVVYGTAFVAPTITDAIISTDQTTMWYVCALSEVTDSGTMTYNDIYYNGQLVTFVGPSGNDANKVASLTNNAVPPQTDTKIAGNLNIYLFTDGSSSGINTNGQTAIQILSDAAIPVYSRWDVNKLMSKTAFAIVKIVYNQDAGTQQLGSLSFSLTNSLDKPGSVILDYLTNIRYGCAIPVSQVNTASLTALNTYSDELITYIPVGGGTATQARYRINGPVNTGQNCLANLQNLTDACDSWLQYSELNGQWKVVINQSYTDYTTLNDLFLVDSSILIGGIDINPIDLNQTYNSLEVGYPNTNIKDQTDYKVFNLIDYVPEVLSPNEAANQLSVNYPQVNNYIQAAYLGERRLLQGREDLIINCALDYSGIQIEAGDVIRVTLEDYGWTEKLFRVSQVQETKNEQGFLGAHITAFEYNDTIYANDPLNDYIPEANTGLTNPKLLATPGTPLLSTNPLTSGTVASFNVVSTTPATGTTMYMDFNYGTTSNTATHKLYKTVQTSDGLPFALSDSISIDVADVPPATYYWSTTARTDVTGYRSNSSASYNWDGPNVTTYNSGTGFGGINFGNMNGSLVRQQILANKNFSIPIISNNTVILPVDLATTITYNIPVYLDGTTVTGTDVYPYFYGTSSTATGYLLNSTASFQPAQASVLKIASGAFQWYELMYLQPAQGFFVNGSTTQDDLDLNVVCDVNTSIQLSPYYNLVATPNDLYSFTHLMETFELKAGLPYNIKTVTTFATLSTILGFGYLVRNMTTGTRVTFVSGTLTLYRSA